MNCSFLTFVQNEGSDPETSKFIFNSSLVASQNNISYKSIIKFKSSFDEINGFQIYEFTVWTFFQWKIKFKTFYQINNSLMKTVCRCAASR